MRRLEKSAAIILLLLGGGAGCAVEAGKEEDRAGQPANASEARIAGGHGTAGDQPEDPSERDILERYERPDPGLDLPAIFHGRWASSSAECRTGDYVLIEPGGYRTVDSIAVLVEPVRLRRETTPDGVPAQSFTAPIEQAADDDELYTGRVRMSRAGDNLYMSNANVVGEAEHWQYRNLRCPAPPTRSGGGPTG